MNDAEVNSRGIVFVPPLEAYERLELLTGRTRPQVQQDVREGKYPTRQGPGGVGREIGIPADAPPRLSEQLATERSRRASLERERNTLRKRTAELEAEKADLIARNRDLTERTSELAAQMEDEVSYRAYLAVTIRMLGPRSFERSADSSLPSEVSSLIPPAEGSDDTDREIMLGDGREVAIDAKLTGALRAYVHEFCRVYGRARFVASFDVPPAALHRWESGHVGFMVPVRILDRIGLEPGAIMAAANELRALDSEVLSNTDDEWSYDPSGEWDREGREVTRVVSVQPKESHEENAFGREVAILLKRWRFLRELVFDAHLRWYDEQTREERLFYRVTLLEVEIALLRDHCMAIAGGNSGYRLDKALWDNDGFAAEVKWRDVELAHQRQLLAREKRRWYRRIFNWLVP